MPNDHATAYHKRMRRVLAHIDAHLDDPLDVAGLSAVAAFSPFHFQRQFSALFGLGVAQYVRALRLHRSAMQLVFRSDAAITGIALDAGYEAPEAFTRAFRAQHGQSPSAFRAAPDWTSWQDSTATLQNIRRMHMPSQFSEADVSLIDFPPTPVALLRHQGDPALLGDTIRRLIEWRRANGLPPAKAATFNLFHNDPAAVAPAEYRIDLAVACTVPVAANPQGVVDGMIEGGRCARLRVIGAGDDLGAAMDYLYGEWLPASGVEARDAPPFAQRISFYPDVPAHEAMTDIFLPLV